MITTGSITRDVAASRFEFLGERFRGRRTAIKNFTHAAPEFVFWIFPDGRLFDAKDAHRRNVPRGYEWIIDDEPNYGGFLRGRVVRSVDRFQLIVVYCQEEALARPCESLSQFLCGISSLPVPLDHEALVVSDNGDIYGTINDLQNRASADA
ncbi:hypothetical protein C7S18_06260 [Ahniella affigens]|uniref:Uncharacterized protein n=1 Tax=Ahniella affigens TaxID=2021234 RepID=A0A2P1PPS8_9GAMM|nr:hypothetical protein [Ahniella affigens]AVP96828.1 hypothetical protein C7S18_06260 [Ahniella affigens]